MTDPSHPSISDTGILFTAPPWQGNAQPLLGPHTLLDPILGRPLLQRAVEHLVLLGCRQLLVMLDDNAAAVRDYLQHGERWGCRITYHYPDPRATLQSFLPAIGISAQQHYLLGNAWSVPDHAEIDAQCDQSSGITWHGSESSSNYWTGWGCVAGSWLLTLDMPVDATLLAEHIAGDAGLAKVSCEPLLDARSPASLLSGIERLLASERDHIQISALADIHPSVRLIAPCHIGKAVRIDAGAVIGPDAVIEDHAYIGADAQIRHSLVLPGTYVGPGLELDQVIVRGPALLNAALGSRTDITDPQILSHLQPTSRQTTRASQLIAATLQLVLLPLYLQLRRLHGSLPAQAGETVLPCPGRHGSGMAAVRMTLQTPPHVIAGEPYDWGQHFVTTFYPGLARVRSGQLRMIGPTLKTWQEARQLPNEWRRIHEECVCGLLNDAWIQPVPVSGSEDAFACDALAATATESPRQIARYIAAYLRNLWRSRQEDAWSGKTLTTHIKPK